MQRIKSCRRRLHYPEKLTFADFRVRLMVVPPNADVLLFPIPEALGRHERRFFWVAAGALQKQARKQVLLCGALLVSFGSDSKTDRARPGAAA